MTKREIQKIKSKPRGVTEYKIHISNNTIKYCYKADNVYNFERRLYFLSLLIEKKIFREMNKNEVKTISNSEKH